jgi:RimJ/RimL family protein N-acetyltransferase
MESIQLFDSYYFREATKEEFEPFFREKRPVVFADSVSFPLGNWLTDDDKAKQKILFDLIKSRYSLRVFIMKEKEIIGWHVGRQIDEDQYHMSNTGIFNEYQGKGIYSAFLPKLLDIFKEKGFQKIVSRHHASNNSVLVPKLKAGFVITGFEIDERFGIFVLLSYIYNEQRSKAYKFRTGAIRPDEMLKRYL